MRTLIARRLDQTDLAARVEWFNNPSVYQQMPIDIPISMSSTLQWYNRIISVPQRKEFCFDILESNQTRFVGAMGGLVAIEHQHRRAELYVIVNPDKFGEGIGKVSVRWLVQYGFSFLGLQKIYLYTLESNMPARKLYENLSFVCEGILRRHHYHLGSYVDRCIYGILREDWQDTSFDVSSGLQMDF